MYPVLVKIHYEMKCINYEIWYTDKKKSFSFHKYIRAVYIRTSSLNVLRGSTKQFRQYFIALFFLFMDTYIISFRSKCTPLKKKKKILFYWNQSKLSTVATINNNIVLSFLNRSHFMLGQNLDWNVLFFIFIESWQSTYQSTFYV